MNNRRLKKALSRIRHLPVNRHLYSYIKNKSLQFYFSSVDSLKVAWPSTMMLELSAACNLACTTCAREYDFGRDMDKGFMDIGLARKIIDDTWPYLDSVGLTGMGETLLYNDIEVLVHYIKSKNRGIIISISTNAHVPDFAGRVNALVNNLDTIQISVDGLENVYESIRRKASFDTFSKNVKAASKICRNSKTDLMLNMVITKENYFQMPAMVSFASENGIAWLDFTMFNLASVTGIDTSYYEFYQTSEFRKYLDEALFVAEQLSVHLNADSFSNDFGNGFKSCPFPFGHFYITWQGYLAPCCAKPFPKEKNFGNLNNSDLLSLLNNNEFINFRELWYQNQTPDFCKNCHFITGSRV